MKNWQIITIHPPLPPPNKVTVKNFELKFEVPRGFSQTHKWKFQAGKWTK